MKNNLPRSLTSSINKITGDFVLPASAQCPKVDRRIPIDLQVEVTRIDFLYSQVINGIVGLVIYLGLYAFTSFERHSSRFLLIFSVLLGLNMMIRAAAWHLWQNARSEIQTHQDLWKWLFAIHLIIFSSVLIWGSIGWYFLELKSVFLQFAIITTLASLSAGVLLSYALSTPAVLVVITLATGPLVGVTFSSTDPADHTFAIFVLVFDGIALFVSRQFSQFMKKTFRLSIDNGLLAADLKAQMDVSRERDRLEASNGAKSMFLANASHEIRTPLAAINGFAESILQNNELTSEARHDLKVILRNGKYLGSLVNDLLDLSQIDAGRLYIQNLPLSPAQEIEDAILVIRSSADAKQIKINIEYSSNLPERIEADPTRFRQIIVNLLSNSVKFTNKGSVTVRVEHIQSFDGRGLLKVKIADTGIGMTSEAKENLFQPFTRGQSVDVQRVPGSGLGLALSQNLAHLMGGEIQLLRSNLGQGSEFEFRLETAEYNHGEVTAPPIPQVLDLRRPLKNVRILVADDSPDLLVLMKRWLELAGALVETARNGAEAVDFASRSPFDLILMDIKMPVMNGYEATLSLRVSGFNRPIVALTAHASTDDRLRCYQAGCTAYISKPVDSRSILDLLQKQLHPNI